MKTFAVPQTLWVVWFSHFVIDLMVGIWPAFKTLAHLDLALAGLILAFAGFIGDGLQIFFGFLGDKGHRQKLIILGLIFSSSAAFLPFANNYFTFFLLVLATYLGSGMFHPSGAGMAQELIPKRKSYAMAIFATGGQIGFAVTQLLFCYIYRSTPFACVSFVIFSVIALFFMTRSKWASPAIAVNRSFSIKKIFETFAPRKKETTLLYFSQLCQQIVMYAFIFLLPDLLVMQGQADWICFGGGHCLFVVGAGITLVPIGLLSDRFGQKNILLIAISIGAIFFYTFLYAPMMPLPLLSLFLISFGGCMGIVNPIGVSLGGRMFPKNSSQISALLMGFVWCMSLLLGPGGGGLLTRLFEESAPLKALALIGMLLPISILLTYLIPVFEKKEEALPELTQS